MARQKRGGDWGSCRAGKADVPFITCHQLTHTHTHTHTYFAIFCGSEKYCPEGHFYWPYPKRHRHMKLETFVLSSLVGSSSRNDYYEYLDLCFRNFRAINLGLVEANKTTPQGSSTTFFCLQIKTMEVSDRPLKPQLKC